MYLKATVCPFNGMTDRHFFPYYILISHGMLTHPTSPTLITAVRNLSLKPEFNYSHVKSIFHQLDHEHLLQARPRPTITTWHPLEDKRIDHISPATPSSIGCYTGIFSLVTLEREKLRNVAKRISSSRLTRPEDPPSVPE